MSGATEQCPPSSAPDERRTATWGEAAAVALGLSTAVMALTLLITDLAGAPLTHMTRDPITVDDSPLPTALIGATSNLGVVLWIGTAVVCLFAAALSDTDAPTTRFLVASGALTALLGLDDLFLLHEQFEHLPGRIGELAYVPLYLGLVSLYLVRFRGELRRHGAPLLAIAFAMFALSVAIDIGFAYSTNRAFLEDGFKLAGIACWTAFFLRVALASARRRAVPTA